MSTWVVEPEPAPETTLVVARPGPVSGRVEDAQGRPVPDVELCLLAPEGFWSRFDVVARSSLELAWTRSRADGSFTFKDAPLVSGARVAAAKDGFLDTKQDVPQLAGPEPAAPGTHDPLVVRMEAAPEELLWRGRVIDAGGRPVAEARVSFGGASTLSDAHGEFMLDARLDHADMRHLHTARKAGLRLRALKTGHLPGSLEIALDPKTKDPVWPGYAVPAARTGTALLRRTGRRRNRRACEKGHRRARPGDVVLGPSRGRLHRERPRRHAGALAARRCRRRGPFRDERPAGEGVPPGRFRPGDARRSHHRAHRGG